jgi:hypothetical protein
MTTKRIKVTNQVGPLQTRDARFDAFDADDALTGIVTDLEGLGLLHPIDLARVKAILEKYTGNSGVTNATGVTRAGDAADARDAADAAGRAAGAKVRAQVEHIQGIAKNYNAFWDRNAEENARSIRR